MQISQSAICVCVCMHASQVNKSHLSQKLLYFCTIVSGYNCRNVTTNGASCSMYM